MNFISNLLRVNIDMNIYFLSMLFKNAFPIGLSCQIKAERTVFNASMNVQTDWLLSHHKCSCEFWLIWFDSAFNSEVINSIREMTELL